MNLNIKITNQIFILGNLHVGSRMVLGYFILRLQSLVTVSMIICLGYLSMILIFEALEFAPKHKKYFKSMQCKQNLFFCSCIIICDLKMYFFMHRLMQKYLKPLDGYFYNAIYITMFWFI